jgi:hypothetical protein
MENATKELVVLARKLTFVGAVTLLEFSIDGSLLYVGVGNSLYFYDTKEGACLGVQSIVQNGTLHGVDFGTFLKNIKNDSSLFINVLLYNI